MGDELGDLALERVDRLGELAQAPQFVARDADAHRLLGARQPSGDAGAPLAVKQRAARQLELGPEVVQVPLQRVVERAARADKPLAMVDQQPNVELRAGQLGRRQRLDAFGQRGSCDGERVDAGRTCRARGSTAASWPSAASAPERPVRRERSETARRSPTRAGSPPAPRHARRPEPGPTAATWSNPRAPTETSCQPSISPVAAATAGDRVRALVHVRTEHDHQLSPLLLAVEVDSRRTRLAGGAATLLSSHAGHPRPATSDTTKGSQATPADSLKESQLAAGRDLPSASDVTDSRESQQQASTQHSHG